MANEKPRVPLRLVLDTHVWLDWLVFEDAGIAVMRDAPAQRFEIFIDARCEAELARILARGFAKRTLDARTQEACIAQMRRIAKRIDVLPQPEGAALPPCRDPDDQKFLEVALAAHADYLITKDRELLRLGGRRSRVPFRILTPGDFARETDGAAK